MRKIALSLAISLASTGFTSLSVNAKEEKVLESIVVIGKATPDVSTDLAGSFDYIGRDELAYEHLDDITELFAKVPGVYLSRFNQGIVNTNLAIRGFAGDGVSPHAKLLIDGIATNTNDGATELDQLFPLNIDNIQTFRATSDPRYGIFNIAGNYQVESRSDTNKEIEVTLGSYSTQEIQGYAGFKSGKLSHSYSLGYRDNEGYRDNTNLTKQAASGRWQYEVNDQTQVTAIARYSHFDGDAPGYLDQQEARRNPESSADFANQDGGIKENHHVSVHLDHQFRSDLNWSLKAYTQEFKRNRWVRFSEASQIQNRFNDDDQIGLISQLTWTIDSNWELAWGLDAQFEDVLEQRFGTVGQTRVRDSNNVLRNRKYSYDSQGTYLQIKHTPNERLSWNFAVRADQLDGDFTQFNADGVQQDREIFEFGTIIQPKFNVIYGLTDTTSVFLNAGRSFQHPTGIAAFTTGDRKARDIAYNDGAEFGASWQIDNLDLRASYWLQQASDELILVDGVTRNVGETDREGLDLAANWQVSPRWLVWANYSLIDTEIVRAPDTAANTEGNELRSIPDFTASLGVGFNVTEKFVVRTHLDTQGDYYANEDNFGGKFGEFTLLHASADYKTTWGTIKFQVNNITDEFYEYVFDLGAVDTDGNVQTDTIHSPGDGRNFNVSFNVNI